jgi:hypothetical protein
MRDFCTDCFICKDLAGNTGPGKQNVTL